MYLYRYATDTGGFNYNSEDSLYTTISALQQKGLKKGLISSYSCGSYSIDKIKLNAYLLANNLTIYPELHTAIITMNKIEKSRFDYQVGDTTKVWSTNLLQ